LQFGYILQLAEQPSPFTVLSSSHYSPDYNTPLPQMGLTRPKTHEELERTKPSAH
jgi:hypothetical protein